MLSIVSHQGNANQNHSEIALHTTRVARIKKQTIGSVGKGVRKLKPSRAAGGDVKCCGCCGKLWQFLKNLNRVIIGPSKPLLDKYPRELRTKVPTITCTCMFRAALVIIAKTVKTTQMSTNH